MNRIPVILATAGHVDHGKSSLVRALTGTDPDRLPEEKRRGMTIELGFAHLALRAKSADAEFDVGIVDVPGHEDFVKNMVAGVGCIDAALLVVAADDGWMPQTEEHLQILSYLAVRHGVVALTKSDLAVDLAAAERSIRERLRATPLAEAPIVRTSTKSDAGLAELRDALWDVFTRITPSRDLCKPRLAVDRAFVLKGVGTVVTGTLSGGMLRRGQEVVVQPHGTATRIRALQSHGNEIETAHPGMRVALNLPDVAPAGTGHRATVGRGDVVTTGIVGVPVKTLDVLLERSPRSPGAPLKTGTVVRIHHGTAAIPGRVRLFDSQELPLGAKALARVTLTSPALVLTCDHLVVRDWSEQHTLAGGIVLDASPPHRKRRAAQKAMLEARAVSPESPMAFVLSRVIRDGICDATGILRQSVFPDAQIQAALSAACDGESVVSFGSLVATSEAWNQLLSETRSSVDAFHTGHPERAGLPLADLERAVTRACKVKGAWEAVLTALTGDSFIRDTSVIRRTAHRPALPARLQPAGDRLRAALARHDLDPPARQHLAYDDIGTQALKFLIANGEAVELGPELVVSSEAYAKAVERVRNHIQTHGPSTVSELKTALHSSRRVMVPLVECLDRDGVTQRRGDLRTLRGRM